MALVPHPSLCDPGPSVRQPFFSRNRVRSKAGGGKYACRMSSDPIYTHCTLLYTLALLVQNESFHSWKSMSARFMLPRLRGQCDAAGTAPRAMVQIFYTMGRLFSMLRFMNYVACSCIQKYTQREG